MEYGKRIDAVVYGSPATADFTREDWLRLALAALDQANYRGDVRQIEKEALAATL